MRPHITDEKGRIRMNAVIKSMSSLALMALGTQVLAAETHGRTFEQLVTVTAKVEKIDMAKREVTLKGPLGNVETIVVGDQVKRLNEIKVGDEVTAEYYIGIAAELRAPTDEEKAQPFVVVDEAGKAPAGQAPAAAGVRTVRVVATIEGLDRPSQTVTLKGPMGRYLTVRVQDPSILLKPRLGDTVVVTAAEALAVSVEKVQPVEKAK
jgi:Cu/Ag efflux protein CusF